MRNDPFKPMNDATCRTEIMSLIGRQLETVYAPVTSAPLPERMMTLLQRLSSVSAAPMSRKSDGAA